MNEIMEGPLGNPVDDRLTRLNSLRGAVLPDDIEQALSGNAEDAIKFIEEHPDQAAAVAKAEKAGKARKTVLAAAEQ